MRLAQRALIASAPATWGGPGELDLPTTVISWKVVAKLDVNATTLVKP